MWIYDAEEVDHFQSRAACLADYLRTAIIAARPTQKGARNGRALPMDQQLERDAHMFELLLESLL